MGFTSFKEDNERHTEEAQRDREPEPPSDESPDDSNDDDN
jgi:hypothetical protein